MKRTVMAVVCLAVGTAAAFGQDERDKRLDDLKREFERTMKGLQEKFEVERGRLEKEFRAAAERLLEKKDDPQEKKEPRGVEDLLKEILKRVESLEKRLDGELPRLREFQRVIPRAFDLQKLPGAMPEEFRKWLEQMPKWKGGEDFKFEFRKADPKKDEEKPKAKPKKKPDDDPQQD
jgi:hypothetical protein